MSSEDFWNSTPKEFHYRQVGYYRKVQRQEESNWNRTRWQTLAILQSNPYIKESLTIQDLAVFPWDDDFVKKKSKKSTMSQEEMERIIRSMDNPDTVLTPIKRGQLTT